MVQLITILIDIIGGSMITLKDFNDWLKLNTSLSESSAYKYSRAVNTISKDMNANGIINDDLLNVSLLKLDKLLPIILNNESFIRKNTIGNNMYSCALKQYRMYRTAIHEFETAFEIESEIEGSAELSETERTALIKARVGQGEFRNKLLEKYDSTCIITGIHMPELLIASHIKPWAVSNNLERLSEDNGLLLNSTYDKLFDCGLITFSDNGAIYISSQIDKRDVDILQLHNGELYNLKTNRDLSLNLEYHRDIVFVK